MAKLAKAPPAPDPTQAGQPAAATDATPATSTPDATTPDAPADAAAPAASQPAEDAPAADPAPVPGRAFLIGGPYSGRFVQVADLNQPVMQGPFEYRKGANLPADIKDRLSPQAGAWEPFGYHGPDQAAVNALKAEFAEADQP